MLIYFFIFLIGISFGSFANVCIFRWLKKESVIKKSSYCPICNKKIKWFDLIPILSWFLLKGKCRYCKSFISAQYPFIEFLSGLIFLFSFYLYGCTLYFIIFSIFLLLVLIGSVTDILKKEVPDEILFVGIFLMAINYMITPNITQSLIGFFACSGFLTIITMITDGGIGGGDIKFLAMIGGFLGFYPSLVVLMGGFVLSSMVYFSYIFENSKKEVPMIPFFSLALVYYLLFSL